MIWFPELFFRFELFEDDNPGMSASVCDVSEYQPMFNGTAHQIEDFCSGHIEDNVYMHTIIIGLACIPTSFWLPLCVHKLGTKFFLVFSLIFAGAVTVGLYFVSGATQNLVLSCIFEALTSLGISTVYCVMVDMFPTNLRWGQKMNWYYFQFQFHILVTIELWLRLSHWPLAVVEL